MNHLISAANAWLGFLHYLVKEICFKSEPWYQNYFWALFIFSVSVYTLELIKPWRRTQPKIRDDFFLDIFYMYFNFFLFKLIFMAPVSAFVYSIFTNFLGGALISFKLFSNNLFPYPMQLIIFFIILDFVQWLTHVALHKFKCLWNFHKVHHSIKMMGFAGHLRYHWVENIIYTPVKFIAIILIGGSEPSNVFLLYYFATLIGHLNHSNLNLSYGPLKFLINNPVMHIWHHSKFTPEGYKFGVNFGISLSIWDYIFKTAYMGDNGRDITLGFKNIEKFPKTFAGQLIYPINRKD